MPNIVIRANSLAGIFSGGGGGGSNRLVGDEWFASDTSVDDVNQLWDFDSHLFETGTGPEDWELAWESSGGPNNRPCVRETVHIGSDGLASSFQKSQVFSPAQCSHGDDFFIRFSIRFATGTGQEQKLIQLSRGDISNERRFILTIEDWGDYAFRLQKDGGDEFIQYPTGTGLTHTDWIDIQLHGRYATDPEAQDGYYAIYYNNDTFGSPTVEVNNIFLPTTATSAANNLNWSGLHQQMIGTKTYRWADFRIGPTFDANWHATGAGA